MRFLFPLLLLLTACRNTTPVAEKYTEKPLSQWVNPFIGTGGHGHTYPGATAPFGMVQLSPDTRLEGWDGCGGYHYSDTAIYGFSHTHLQGTGVSDYGDILFMPTSGKTRQADTWNEAWKSRFRHDSEVAHAGYYAVQLDDYGIRAELTTTTRVGIHRYTLAPGDTCRLFLDFMHRDELLYYDVRTYGDTAISGFRVSKAWAEEQHCYFYAVFSRPFSGMDQLMQRTETTDPATGKRKIILEDIQAFSLLFAPSGISPENQLVIRVGISGVDEQGAMKNLYAEAPHRDFDRYAREAAATWDSTLARCPAPRQTMSSDQRKTFFTALYHCYTVPHTWSDVDRRYRGMDQQVHTALDYTRYTVFSLWDTFRAYHPLMCKLEPERTRDMIRTFLGMYRERGELPVWELSANETYCMIGYHSVPVIYDAWMRGIRDFDTRLALEAMVASARGPQEEKKLYARYGYVPGDLVSESVSKTLEFAYDDWCIAQFAKELGELDIYAEFIRRSQSWKHLYDPSTRFMRARRNGGFSEPFDPFQVDFNYTEANAWQYALFVPHQLDAFTSMLGGKESLILWLDSLYAAPSSTTGREQADITGLIGQYAHGNEPSHHVPFLYAYAGSPKHKEIVETICSTYYHNSPDGLCGNEDCGQMSAWFVCTMLDFYPIIAGAEVTGVMSGNSVQWPQAAAQPIDPSYEVLPLPVISGPQTSFSDSVLITITSAIPDAKIRYSVNFGGMMQGSSLPENTPVSFYLSKSATITASNEGQSELQSQARFVRRSNKRKVISTSGFDQQYTGGGADALVDEIRGSADFRTGQWQGYWKKNLEVVIDLGQEETIRELGLGCYQDTRPWIWMPSRIAFFTSGDAVAWSPFGELVTDEPVNSEEAITRDFMAAPNSRAPHTCRYLKVVAVPAFDRIPDWHLGAGGHPWIFVDEVIIR